jgi:hypothetical protein
MASFQRAWARRRTRLRSDACPIFGCRGGEVKIQQESEMSAKKRIGFAAAAAALGLLAAAWMAQRGDGQTGEGGLPRNVKPWRGTVTRTFDTNLKHSKEENHDGSSQKTDDQFTAHFESFLSLNGDGTAFYRVSYRAQRIEHYVWHVPATTGTKGSDGESTHTDTWKSDDLSGPIKAWVRDFDVPGGKLQFDDTIDVANLNPHTIPVKLTESVQIKGSSDPKGLTHTTTAEDLIPAYVFRLQITSDFRPGARTVSGDLSERYSPSDLGATCRGQSHSPPYSTYEGEGKASVTWDLTLDPPDLKVVVEPQDYDRWTPASCGETDAANDLRVIAHLRTLKGEIPSQMATKFTFELVNVSREPGVCMNYPAKPKADPDADLQFVGRRNPGLEVEDEQGRPADVGPKVVVRHGNFTVGDFTDASASVSSFDWGAYGELRVTAETADGKKYVGRLAGGAPVLIPKRRPGSRIADAWKQDNHVPLDTPDDADDADEPKGAHPDQALLSNYRDHVSHGSAVKGDGLTLYEKYRGFRVWGDHVCGDPHRKNVFIYDDLHGRSADGIVLFKALSGLAVHYLDRDEIGPGDETFFHFSKRKGLKVVVNGNASGRSPHKAPKYGIYLVGDANADGSALGEGGPGVPKQAYITRGFDPGPLGWKKFPSGKGLIISDYYAATIAHEMLHCCNVPHHGDNDRKWVTWRSSTANPGGVEEVWGNKNNGGVTQITVRWEEDGDSFHALVLPCKVYVACQHGQHSGCVDCVMRYDVAGAYIPEGDDYARVLIPPGHELTGMGLCDAAEDAPGAVDPLRNSLPRRCGAAAQGQGYCKSQICVNDAYKAP